jgi:phenylacetic acid degradation operon negative regulatory protein
MTQRPAGPIVRSPSMAPLRPRSMLFTLFGDYAYPKRRDVPLRGLVEMGQALGLSEVAVRSAVARLAREGWILARRERARSRYGLSAAGRALIEEGTRRIYRPRAWAWDGVWCVLNYSIPEAKRSDRDRIRKQLAWLGFGPMGGGAYASPRDVGDELLALLGHHKLHAYARVFSGRLEGPGRDADLVSQCWDLRAIARRYEAFIAHYEPVYRRDRALRSRRALEDVDAFVTRFALTHDFRRFPFVDPDLPSELLPRNWAGTRARRLFEAHHALLTGGALRFFETIASRNG